MIDCKEYEEGILLEEFTAMHRGSMEKAVLLPPLASEPFSCKDYNPEVTISTSLSGAITLHYQELIVITKSPKPKEGAILFTFLNKEDGTEDEYWLPKRLCSNLNEAERTIRVWDVFLKSKTPELLAYTHMIHDCDDEEGR